MPVPPSLADRAGALLAIAARTGQELAGKRLAPLGLNVRLCGVLKPLTPLNLFANRNRSGAFVLLLLEDRALPDPHTHI